MTDLRIDLSMRSEKEMEELVEDIVENTHYKDVKMLHFKLDEAIESHERGLHQPELNINII